MLKQPFRLAATRPFASAVSSPNRIGFLHDQRNFDTPATASGYMSRALSDMQNVRLQAPKYNMQVQVAACST